MEDVINLFAQVYLFIYLFFIGNNFGNDAGASINTSNIGSLALIIEELD